MEIVFALDANGAFQIARSRLVVAGMAGDVIKGVAQRLDADGAKIDLHGFLLLIIQAGLSPSLWLSPA